MGALAQDDRVPGSMVILPIVIRGEDCTPLGENNNGLGPKSTQYILNKSGRWWCGYDLLQYTVGATWQVPLCMLFFMPFGCAWNHRDFFARAGSCQNDVGLASGKIRRGIRVAACQEPIYTEIARMTRTRNDPDKYASAFFSNVISYSTK